MAHDHMQGDDNLVANGPTHTRNASSPRRFGAASLTLLLGSLMTLALAACMGTLSAPVVRADAANDADVIVQFDTTDILVRPITFTQPISGLAALERAGLEVVTADFGEFGLGLCSINGVGCPADDCFCGGDNFWNYSFWDGNGWQSYPVGAADSVISQTGAIEGFRWGEWQGVAAPASQVLGAPAALDWLRDHQKADGSYGSAGSTADVMFAAASNGIDPTGWQSSTVVASSAPNGVAGISLLAYWASDAITTDGYLNNADRYAATNAASAGKLIVAAAAVGQDVRSFAGVDLVARLTQHYSASTGAFGASNWDQAFGILGWTAAYTEATPPPPAVVTLLVSRVMTDGGWGVTPALGSDTNSTALVIQALMAANQSPCFSLVKHALAYLQTAQNDDGGFPSDPGDPSDANSTAFVIQALAAAGQDAHGAAWTRNGNTPISYLTGLQLDDGAFAWKAGEGANQLATQQAVPALLSRPLALNVPSHTCYDLFAPVVASE